MKVQLAKVGGEATIYVLTDHGEIAGEMVAKITWYPGKESWADMVGRMLTEARQRAANGADAPAAEARP